MPKKRNFLGGMQNYNPNNGEYEPSLVGSNGKPVEDADGDGVSHENKKKELRDTYRNLESNLKSGKSDAEWEYSGKKQFVEKYGTEDEYIEKNLSEDNNKFNTTIRKLNKENGLSEENGFKLAKTDDPAYNGVNILHPTGRGMTPNELEYVLEHGTLEGYDELSKKREQAMREGKFSQEEQDFNDPSEAEHNKAEEQDFNDPSERESLKAQEKDYDKKSLVVQSLENQVSKNPQYREIANSLSENKDVREAYFYGFKDAYERSGYNPSQKDIERELSNRYWELADSYRDRYGMSDGEWDRNGSYDFEEKYGTEEEFISKGLEAHDKYMNNLGPANKAEEKEFSEVEYEKKTDRKSNEDVEGINDEEIDEELFDRTWAITDKTSVKDYAELISENLKVPYERVLARIRKNKPEAKETDKMSVIAELED